jgi:acid phosphatase type 7
MVGMEGSRGLVRRGLAAAALMAGALAVPGTAWATPRVLERPAAGPAGSRATLAGGGFHAGEPVALTAGGRTLARVRADGHGRFRAAVVVPGSRGWAALTARGRGRGRTVRVRFRITSSPGATGASEIATASGARLRWSPLTLTPPAKVRLAAAGLRRGAAASISWRGATARARTSARGALSQALAVPAGTRGRLAGSLRVGSVRLSFAVEVRPPGSSAFPTLPVTQGPRAPRPPRAPGPVWPRSTDPRVVAVGDIACDPDSGFFNNGEGIANACHQLYTADLVAQIQPDAIVGLGDYQYENGTLDKYHRAFDLSWGYFRSLLHPAPANEHDQYGGGDWYSYWKPNLPAGTAPYAGYSWDLGAWHLIALPAGCDNASSGGCAAGTPLEKWLKADLAAHANACTLAYWHTPRWTSGPRHASDASYDAFLRDLYNAGADLVLSSGNHNYERFAPQRPDGTPDAARGVTEFVVGTGGKSLDAFSGTPERNSVARNGDTYGVLALTLHPTGWDARFVPEAGGSYTDTSSGSCH